MASNNNQTVSVNAGGGWAILATIVLVVLKVNPGGNLDSVVQDWPWWLVLIPLWLGIAVLLVVGIIGLVVFLLGSFISDKAKARQRNEILKARANIEKERKDRAEALRKERDARAEEIRRQRGDN